MKISHFFLVCVKLICFFRISTAADIITVFQSISDGQTLISKGGSFELGFFSPGNSKNRYVGIWTKNIRNTNRFVVWVANRVNPINDTSGLLMINSTNLVILSHNNKTVVWSSNSSRKANSNPLAQLLDSGNLVLREENGVGDSDVMLWQSFDYPSDALLPGMKLGWDLRTGLNRRLSAWKNPNDPSPGELTLEMELHAYPEIVMWKGSQKHTRRGPWNGIGFSGNPEMRYADIPYDEYNIISNREEVYYAYHLRNTSVVIVTVLNETEYSRNVYMWVEADQRWKLTSSVPRDYCDNYGQCGAYGVCSIGEWPVCQCLKGFKLKSPGCERNKPLNCSNKAGFVEYSGLKLPDTTNSWLNQSMNLKECRAKCLNNCSCMAYTNSDIRDGGSGCALWFGDLIDIRKVTSRGLNLYVRMDISESEMIDGNKMKITVIIVASISLASGILLVGGYFCRRWTNSKARTGNRKFKGHTKEDLELPLFDLATLANATNNFSVNNKLGEGGFGPVYKGILVDGQEIAVKRLSRSSGQGLNELKNEVCLIAKLQHRNLVKLLGCCLEKEENMLIYEFMPNKSLDYCIFGETQGSLLDWSKRFHIICGLARGLLYLHQDSRLRIIHRDLKPSNVLLDKDMNPKISDFGLAKTFGGDQIEGTTNRVVGTYGYMAPEYAIDGIFSVKSDVFSFGILLLEIVSGKKNRGVYHPGNYLSIIGHAWTLWTEGRHLELIDQFLGESYTEMEVSRCVHVGLLCVQHYPQDRPSMSSVVMMLGNDQCALPQPKQPAFFLNRNPPGGTYSPTEHDPSINEVTFTLLNAR